MTVPPQADTEEKMQRLHSIYPTRNPVHWRMRGGIAVITYKKEFRPLERFLYRKLGGSEIINRPLDEMGTRIWILCDGRRDLAEICGIMDEEFRERIEPVSKRVWGLIEILIRIGLMRVEGEPRGKLPRRVLSKRAIQDAENP